MSRKTIALRCPTNNVLDSARHFLSPKFLLISEISSFSTATGDYTQNPRYRGGGGELTHSLSNPYVALTPIFLAPRLHAESQRNAKEFQFDSRVGPSLQLTCNDSK